MKMYYTNWSAKVFPGFYESVYENSDTLYYPESTLGSPVEDGTELMYKNFSGYMKDVAILHIREMADQVTEKGIVKKMALKEVQSPRYYNFYTDTIVVSVDFDLRKLKSYCFKDHADIFDRYLHDQWSSRSGFISFVDNNLRDFKWTYETDMRGKSDCINVMLEFYFLQEISFDYVEDSVLDQLYEIRQEHLCLYKNGKTYELEYNNAEDLYQAGTLIA